MGLKGIFKHIIDAVINSKKHKERKKKKKNFKTGNNGEIEVKNFLSKRGFKESILHDILVRDDKTGKLAQIDLVIIGSREISIVEVKTQNFHTITGHTADDEWILTYGKNSVFKSNNIYMQVKRQENALKSLMKKHNIDIPVKSYIFINSDNKVTVQIKGLSNTSVSILQDYNVLISNIQDKTKNKLLYNILVDENKRHAYVRKYHAK